jgi:ATP-binding cassette subfamily B protein
MDSGKIVGEGTHDELLSGNEVYQEIVKSQT